jgi:hypothetical protein
VYARTLLPKREPKRPIGLSCMEMLSMGPQAAMLSEPLCGFHPKFGVWGHHIGDVRVQLLAD